MAFFFASVALSGCDAPDSRSHHTKSVDGNAGTLTWNVGPQTGELRLSRVENRLEDGTLHIRAWGDEAIPDPSGQLRVPVVLFGTLPATGELEHGQPPAPTAEQAHGMTATIPNATFDGFETIPILKIFARDTDGIDADWSCTSEGRRVITCTGAQPMPWTATAPPPPTAGFRAFFGFN